MTPPPPPGVVTGFWDYGLVNDRHGGLNVVVVDTDGAGVLACADTPGDQLKHVDSCPLDGPCRAI
jgi:hypothetical protein